MSAVDNDSVLAPHEAAAAAFGLEALGVDHPHRRWSAAVQYLHALRDKALHDLDHSFATLRLFIETQRAFEARGGTFAPDKSDIEEAMQCIAAVEHEDD